MIIGIIIQVYILGAFLYLLLGFCPAPIFGPPNTTVKELILWPYYLAKDILGTTGEGQ